MCTTCGCSDDAHATFIDSVGHPVGSAEHEHTHAHDGGDAHNHAHGRHHHTPIAQDGQTPRTLRLEQDILAKNNRLAERNRGWLEGRGVVALNVMSAPGAGKTTLLERTIRDLGAEIPIAVIEGDQATARDAERIQASGGRVVQINTGSGCHLDAEMVAHAARALDPLPGSLLLIENVGNLVCPALFDLGEGTKVVIMSVTEGEDKPIKYPHMFRAGDVMILTKTDLLPHLQFDAGRCVHYAQQVNPRLQIFRLSAVSGDGLEPWYAWLRAQMAHAAS